MIGSFILSVLLIVLFVSLGYALAEYLDTLDRDL